MPTVVGIRFKKASKIYYFDPVNTGVKQGDAAIVETARGVEYGDVVIGPREVEAGSIVSPLKPVMRKATAADAEKMADNRVREKEAFNICLRKIKNHDLPMRLIDVEFTFDVNKIIFYFTAEGRIDFRELVKDLAAVFRTRIELRQIGVRDEAKMLGGIGCCGRPLCCATFLGDFEPVSIRMAKDQGLSLNPTKISGICGRLMCCLKYENHMYCNGGGCGGCRKDRTDVPKIGAMVVTPLGEGKVVGINRGQRTASVQLAPDNTIQVEWEEIIDASQADNV
ncbi:MAG: stage 0 sporulation family protein [Acidaminococcaceae bacterium]|nr:stage 0 sporulation family protein [Acidaminococcaceae bacterium]